MDGQRSFRFNGHLPFDDPLNTWMPRPKVIRSGWNVIDGKSPVLVAQDVVRIINCNGPTLHIRVKSALHDEGSAFFAQLELPNNGLSPFMVVLRVKVAPFMTMIKGKW